MKPRRGCDSCRRRHIKCTRDEDAVKCKGCVDKSLDCEFGPKFTFKHVQHSSGRNGTIAGETHAAESGLSSSGASNLQRSLPRATDGIASSPGVADDQSPGPLPTPGTSCFSIATNTQGQPLNWTPYQHQTKSSVYNRSEIEAFHLPASSPTETFATCESAASILQHAEDLIYQPPLLSKREAELLRIYIHHLGPSSDACDEAHHFTAVIPRLAVQEPILLQGILALAARYDSLKNSLPGLEATYYHSKQIELLIAALDRPSETYNVVLLCAVVISRLFEEYDPDEDAFQHHLLGTSQLLSHGVIAGFVAEGGLAEAASWLHLRQAIYVSLVKTTPLNARLENFATSTTFQRDNDGAYANRVVYLLAKCLKLFFPASIVESPNSVRSTTSIDQYAIGDWEDINDEVDVWLEARPKSFLPTHSEGARHSSGRPFPEVWMIAASHVIGMQHFHAAKILYHLHHLDSPSSTGFRTARIRRDHERSISTHLCFLMGLTNSNPSILNAYFLPSHLLSLCGYCLRNKLEREHTISFLQQANKAVAWKVDKLLDTLQTQWRELDELDGR